MKYVRSPLLALGLLAAVLVSPSVLPGQQPQRINEKELRDWADRGDADAQFELGLRMITGEGVQKNLGEGVKSVERRLSRSTCERSMSWARFMKTASV